MILSPFGRRVPALVLGLAVAGVAAVAGGLPGSEAGKAGGVPAAHIDAPRINASRIDAPRIDAPRCEIAVTEQRGSTTIEGRVTTDRALSGSYHLAIAAHSGAGRSAITQSGTFEARPGAPAILGQTTLSGARRQFRVELEVTVEGRRLHCSEAGPAVTL